VRNDLLREADLSERLAHHHARGNGRQRNADRLGDERESCGSREDSLEHVDDAVLDRVLDVDEPDHAQRLGESHRVRRMVAGSCP
jgi:hypothetical protein